jgi:hypothetical protein
MANTIEIIDHPSNITEILGKNGVTVGSTLTFTPVSTVEMTKAPVSESSPVPNVHNIYISNNTTVQVSVNLYTTRNDKPYRSATITVSAGESVSKPVQGFLSSGAGSVSITALTDPGSGNTNTVTIDIEDA